MNIYWLLPELCSNTIHSSDFKCRLFYEVGILNCPSVHSLWLEPEPGSLYSNGPINLHMLYYKEVVM
jgi:hypothetical protein